MSRDSTTFRIDGFQPAVFAVFIILAVVYAGLFFRLYPFIPGIGDDWTYLAMFRGSMLPDIKEWNPARILPELLMPLSGYFAVYVIRPLFGLDYLQGLITTCSGLATVAWLALSVFAYRLFLAVTRERIPALCGLCLFTVTFFQVKAGLSGLPLVVCEPLPTPTILFFYGLPNILNAVLFIVLCQALLNNEDTKESFFATPIYPPNTLSGLQNHATPLACCLIVIYFAQFSMTISSAISAIPAGCLLLLRLISYTKNADGKLLIAVVRKCTFLDLFCFMLVIFWFIAAFYDLHGARYAYAIAVSREPPPFLEILARYAEALPKRLGLIAIVLIVINSGIAMRDRKNGKVAVNACGLFSAMMGLSFFLLLTLNILIFMKTGKGLNNSFIFGLRLYVYVTLVINMLFLYNRIPLTIIGMSVFVLYLFLYVTMYDHWEPRPMQAAEYRQGIIRMWLNDIIEADKAGKQDVYIVHRESRWPVVYEWYAERFSGTLFRHGITTKEMTIHFELIE